MAITNDQSTLVGLFKEVYARSIVDAWPDVAKLQTKVKFSQAEAIGNHFNQPVDLQFEHGFTAAAFGAVVRDSAYLPPSAGQMQNAQVQGFQVNGRSQVGYSAVAASTSAGGREDQKKAFRAATEHVVKRLEGSAVKRIEIEMLHGQLGLGVITANPANGASRDVVITAATWSPAIWAAAEGATLDLWNAGLTAKVSTGSGGPDSSGGDAIQITSVDPATRTLTLSCPNAADQTLNLANLNIFWETFSPSTEMAGFLSLGATTAASNPVFGINPADYSLWQSNQYSVAGAISFSKLMQASAQIANYGGVGDATAVVSPSQFEVINTDLAALRQFDVSYTKNKGESGVKSITFYNQVGSLEVMPHLYQKAGYAVIFMDDDVKRIGSSDLDFVRGGVNGPQLFFNVGSANALEMRIFSEQALMVNKLRSLCLLTGITP